MFYLIEKANEFLKKGYLLYRNKDFFHLPPLDISSQEHASLYNIAQQISEYNGIFPHQPLTTSLAHLQLFLESMHCLITSYNEETISIQHVMSSSLTGKLYCIFQDMKPSARLPFPFIEKRRKAVGPSFPVVTYQPILIFSELVHVGRIQNYWYQLHINCKTDSNIQYQSMLICIDPSLAVPCFLVTEEIGEECLFFCSFDAEGHHNFGPCDFESVDEFFQAALPKAEEFFLNTKPKWLVESAKE